MATIKRKQGNALRLSIPGESFDLVDATWANWSGTYKIFDSDGIEALSGNLTKHATTLGQFYIIIGATAMSSLLVGTYTVVAEIVNVAADYVLETEDQALLITAQRM